MHKHCVLQHIVSLEAEIEELRRRVGQNKPKSSEYTHAALGDTLKITICTVTSSWRVKIPIISYLTSCIQF